MVFQPAGDVFALEVLAVGMAQREIVAANAAVVAPGDADAADITAAPRPGRTAIGAQALVVRLGVERDDADAAQIGQLLRDLPIRLRSGRVCHDHPSMTLRSRASASRSTGVASDSKSSRAVSSSRSVSASSKFSVNRRIRTMGAIFAALGKGSPDHGRALAGTGHGAPEFSDHGTPRLAPASAGNISGQTATSTTFRALDLVAT